MKEEKNNIQAVILAAGRGTRMLPLTETRPKPMQEVLGKNLIEWKLEALPPSVCDIVIVIGYQGEQIRGYFGDAWKGKPIRYIVQRELNGTAGALWKAKDLLREKFLVMMGDDLYERADILGILEHDFAIGAGEVWKKEVGGEMIVNPDGTFAGVNEPKHFVEHGFMNTGLYVLSPKLFDYDLVPIGMPAHAGNSSAEFGLPHTLAALAKEIPVVMFPVSEWFQVTTPEDLLRAEQFVRERKGERVA